MYVLKKPHVASGYCIWKNSSRTNGKFMQRNWTEKGFGGFQEPKVLEFKGLWEQVEAWGSRVQHVQALAGLMKGFQFYGHGYIFEEWLGQFYALRSLWVVENGT